MFADILTKSMTGLKQHEALQRLFAYLHYTPVDSLHYKLLNVDDNLYIGSSS